MDHVRIQELLDHFKGLSVAFQHLAQRTQTAYLQRKLEQDDLDQLATLSAPALQALEQMQHFLRGEPGQNPETD